MTDVLSRAGGVCSISLSGETGWQPLAARLTDDVSSLLIANVDGIPGDDMVRFVPIDRHNAKWEVSSSGVTGWQTLATMDWNIVFSFVGNFDTAAGAELLMVDASRQSRIRRAGSPTFRTHGLYAH